MNEMAFYASRRRKIAKDKTLFAGIIPRSALNQAEVTRQGGKTRARMRAKK